MDLSREGTADPNIDSPCVYSPLENTAGSDGTDTSCTCTEVDNQFPTAVTQHLTELLT